jgi:ribosomal protein L9
LKKSQEKLEDFTECVNIAEEKNEIDKKQYIELIEGFNNYEKSNMLIYADGNKNSLIFANPSNNDLYEKINKLKTEMINPFISIRDFLQEETLDIEAMFKAIKKFYNLLETEKELKLKLENLEEDIKREQKGEFNIFQSFFKAKEEIIKETEKEKELTQQKILDINEIIEIVGYHLENKIESFKKEKTQNYYKYLKIFAIMQREANKVIRELWSLVKSSLNDKEPQAIKEKKEAEKKNLEKLNKMKSKMIENQKRSRENNNNSGEMTEEQKNIKINEVLEDMCIYGTVTKNEIKEEKIKNPEKFIETNKAL